MLAIIQTIVFSIICNLPMSMLPLLTSNVVSCCYQESTINNSAVHSQNEVQSTGALNLQELKMTDQKKDERLENAGPGK